MKKDLENQIREVFDLPQPKRKEQFFRTNGIGSEKRRSIPVILKIAPAVAAAAVAAVLLKTPAAVPPPRDSIVPEVQTVTESVTSPPQETAPAQTHAAKTQETQPTAPVTDERKPDSTAQAVTTAARLTHKTKAANPSAETPAAPVQTAAAPQVTKAAEKTAPVIVTTVPATAALPATTLPAGDDPEGDEEYMKKYTAFVTAILTFAGVLPTNVNAEEYRNFTGDEMLVIQDMEDSDYLPDLNGNGKLDIGELFEYYHYTEVYSAALKDAREKYGYFGLIKYHAEDYAEDFAVFDADLLDAYRAAVDKETDGQLIQGEYPPFEANYAVQYYLYVNGYIPTTEEIKAELEGYQFRSTTGAEYVDSFCEYVEGIRENFMKRIIVPTDEEAVIFAKLDSGELEKDLNGDGVFDYFDYEDMTQTLFIPMYEKNRVVPYVPGSISDRITELGDLNQDGSFDENDAALLIRYYMRDTDYIPSSIEIGRHMIDLRTKYIDSGETPDMAAAPATGDANCDGTVTLNDAVAVL